MFYPTDLDSFILSPYTRSKLHAFRRKTLASSESMHCELRPDLDRSRCTFTATGSGQHYMRNRYYDPKSGRFTHKDPIGRAGGVNSYGFADGMRPTLEIHLAVPGLQVAQFRLD